ncbi:alpha/beta hydrolase [Streptomyces sp. NPDC046915]|uniref:alpha/beta fold hydrolase n=1 Tax=Streptomyces sp. NPDC046915 TaxID=3155257 RepID=UPI0033C5669C
MRLSPAPVPLSHATYGRGAHIVLLHGVGLDGTMWERCVPALAADHRVTVADLRGHGGSPPAALGVRLDDLAADVAALLDGPAHLVGFSLGALVAQHLALAAPRSTASLTLVSSVAGRSDTERAAVALRRARAREDFAGSARAAVERWFSPEWREREPALAGTVLDRLLSNDRTSYLACYDVFATADAALWPELPRITAPTLAVTGSDDPGSTPQMSRRLASRIPNGRAMVVPGARHLLPLECPEALNDAILQHIGSPAARTAQESHPV